MVIPLHPLNDWMVCERDVPLEMTDGGIHLPQRYRQKAITATVVKVSAEVEDFEPGDRIVIGKFDGWDINLKTGQKFMFARPQDVICTLVDEAQIAEMV